MLQARIDSLETQSSKDAEELTRLSMHLTNTMRSFKSLSVELDNLSMQLVQEKTKVRTEQEKVRVRNTVLLWAGMLFLINMAGKVVMFILYAKRMPVPRWLDIII